MTFAIKLALAFGVMLAANVEGVIYTRWGRTTCRDGTALLYTGYMATAHYTHPGGGSNYLCMHSSPQTLSQMNSASEFNTAWIYGVEYQTAGQYAVNNKPFSWANNNGQNLNDNNAPCAICYLPNVNEIMTNIGRNDCGGADGQIMGMDVEYRGFLMSQHNQFAGKTEFICVDEAPERIPGGEANQDGGLLYPAQTSCSGSGGNALKCPPYVHGNEVACSVCTYKFSSGK